MLFPNFIYIAAGLIFCATTTLVAQAHKSRPAGKTAAASSVQEIPWHGTRKLIWEDFKARAGANETKYALTTSGISVGTKCNEGKFSYQVEAVFVPKESWTRDKTSDNLLAHEQAHFDITELHARKLRLIFSQLSDGCLLNSDQISKLVNPIYEASDKMQEEYDKTTNHGLNREAQKQWEQIIAASLKALEQVAQ